MKAFALNRMDAMQREGKYPVATKGSPLLGVEISGIVESVGKDGKKKKKKMLKQASLIHI